MFASSSMLRSVHAQDCAQTDRHAKQAAEAELQQTRAELQQLRPQCRAAQESKQQLEAKLQEAQDACKVHHSEMAYACTSCTSFSICPSLLLSS